MAIANASERGGVVFVYDERGNQLCMITGGGNVLGFTSTTVSIKRGGSIFVYNEKGNQISIRPG